MSFTGVPLATLLQIGAIGFHLKRGEATNTPFNFFLVALALFVVWGRRRARQTATSTMTAE